LADDDGDTIRVPFLLIMQGRNLKDAAEGKEIKEKLYAKTFVLTYHWRHSALTITYL
jgi:hypothetical protein